MYAIKNEHGDFYTGNDYFFQGEKYAIFSRFREEYKKYKSLKIAENVKKRLELSCNGFDSLKVVQISEDRTCSVIEEELLMNKNKKKKDLVFWENIFKQVNGEIEFSAVELSGDRKTYTIFYLMPYSETQNTYNFSIDSQVQEVIDGFCTKVKERANEMIEMIKSCADSVEDYFNMEE